MMMTTNFIRSKLYENENYKDRIWTLMNVLLARCCVIRTRDCYRGVWFWSDATFFRFMKQATKKYEPAWRFHSKTSSQHLRQVAAMIVFSFEMCADLECRKKMLLKVFQNYFTTAKKESQDARDMRLSPMINSICICHSSNKCVWCVNEWTQSRNNVFSPFNSEISRFVHFFSLALRSRRSN